jgi:hypothetical protein
VNGVVGEFRVAGFYVGDYMRRPEGRYGLPCVQVRDEVKHATQVTWEVAGDRLRAAACAGFARWPQRDALPRSGRWCRGVPPGIDGAPPPSPRPRAPAVLLLGAICIARVAKHTRARPVAIAVRSCARGGARGSSAIIKRSPSFISCHIVLAIPFPIRQDGGLHDCARQEGQLQ